MISIFRRNRARASSLSVFCAALFSVAYAPSWGTEPAEQPQLAVFMAYNLKNYLRMPRRVDGESADSAPKPEREIAAAVTMILKGRPDILGLVEIGTLTDLRDLQERLDVCGLDLPHATINQSFDDERRVALISRFPIVEENHQSDLTYRLGQREMPFRRGILDATIQINGGYRLRALGVHLKSKREVSEGDQALMRRHEAHLTRRHAETILRSDPETNLILFGDFNDTPNAIAIKAIRGRYGTRGYLKDIPAEDDLGYKWTYHWSYEDQYSRFDYLFVNKALLPEIIEEKSFIVSDPVWFTASDHRPVVTTLVAAER